MASVYYLYQDALHIDETIILEYKARADASGCEYFAAARIQSCWRGYKTRKDIASLVKAAKTMQRYIRGFLVRYKLPEMLQEHYDDSCLKLYNIMAVRIQSRWRGYWIRTYKVCIKDIIREKKEMQMADEEMRKFFDEQRKLSTEGGDIALGKEMIAATKTNVEQIVEVLFERHHLLSTNRHRGVLSENGDKELSQLETLLKCLPWKDYMNKIRKVYRRYWREDKREDSFTATKSDITFEVESDKPHFILTSKIERKPYEPLITNTGVYRRPMTNIVRSSDSSKNISNKEFDLQVFRNLALESRLPPYYVDFWFRMCEEHM